jgi:hypothetical protein
MFIIAMNAKRHTINITPAKIVIANSVSIAKDRNV